MFFRCDVELDLALKRLKVFFEFLALLIFHFVQQLPYQSMLLLSILDQRFEILQVLQFGIDLSSIWTCIWSARRIGSKRRFISA